MELKLKRQSSTKHSSNTINRNQNVCLTSSVQLFDDI